MTLGFKLFAAVLLAAFGPVLAESASAQTRVALHATQEEINIWKQRRVSGPYLDDWNHILANANAFKTSPSGDWAGNQSSTLAWDGAAVDSCSRAPTFYPGGSSSDCEGDNGRRHADRIRDAGFVWMVTGDTSYRDPVIRLLLNQAGNPGTDFSKTTRWPTNYGNKDKDFHISIWLRKMAYAYSYVRGSMTAPQQATMDAWFNRAATWLQQMIHRSAGSSSRFPNRYNNDYSNTPGTSSCSVCGTGLTHFGGYKINGFGYAWDNKATNHNAAAAAIGAVTGDAVIIDRAKLFVKEWIKFQVGADGTVWDQIRWQGGTAQGGWNYATTTIGSVISAVDHIARTGDPELYTYSTSTGLHWSSGGPKSLLKVLQRYSNLALGNTIIYASNTSTTDPALRIDPEGSIRYVNDVAWSQANIFYKDALITQAVNRSKPTSTSYGGYNPWGGDWGNLPGARFMFGQMEGKVSPYTGEIVSSPSPSPSLDPPTNLTVRY